MPSSTSRTLAFLLIVLFAVILVKKVRTHINEEVHAEKKVHTKNAPMRMAFTEVSKKKHRRHNDDDADDKLKRIVDLRGQWRFKIGDDPDWAAPRYKDVDWDEIFVPSQWEDEGYAGYDGYAWYRKSFTMPTGYEGEPLLLRLGRVDDVDAVYLNGYLIGTTGQFDRPFQTAYHVFREYAVPVEYLNVKGRNVIAVRVYDKTLEGGILEGQVGLFERSNRSGMEIDLSGAWQFRPGDDPSWRAERVDKANWTTLTAPMRWDLQGYADLEGYAWYRKRFFVPASLRGKDLTLYLGKIDDLDQTFLNGQLVGSTGDIEGRDVRGDEWQMIRAYTIPDGTLRYGEYNTVAVRVYDGPQHGGIFEGPLGISTREHLEDKSPRPKERTGFWEWFKDWWN